MNSEIAKSRIGEVIRIDTVTSTQADFLATHVPVQNIHIRNKWDSKTDKVMSEEKVFNKYVLNTENEHQFIIVIELRNSLLFQMMCSVKTRIRCMNLLVDI